MTPTFDDSPHRPKPRLILLDDNIRDVGGHFYELATLLLAGAEELGLQNILATNACFDQPQAVTPDWHLYPTFHTRRLVRWSLGVDGVSRYQRDLTGKAIGGSQLSNACSAITDRLLPPRKWPRKMLGQWADDLCRLLAKVKPTSADSFLVNTGDDFAMLALAAALGRSAANLPPLRIDVIFHFALYESGHPDRRERLRQLGQQLRSTLAALRPHDVHLHATTDALAAQLRETECGARIHSIPYPTRRRRIARGSSSPRIKAVLAGLPRAEKGREAIADLLSGIRQPHLESGRYQVSMQMPADRWQTMVPESLYPSYERGLRGDAGSPLEIRTANLSTDAYHQWLDTADLGLFLYDPKRYVARCSGVLLEMLARGVPVIVPDGCWLADQVRLAGGYRSIGLIYQSRAEIPDLMQHFAEHRGEITERSIQYAATIANRHDGRNTLLEMGIVPPTQSRAA